MPSVQYSDFLAVTLPVWRALRPDADIVVVTSPDDRATQDVATAHDARVLVTEVWTANGAILNKGAALDLAFDETPYDELCVSADADVYPCGRFPKDDEIDRHTIYSCPRYHVASQADVDAHLSGRLTREQLPLISPRYRGGEPEIGTRMDPRAAAAKCLGYVQIFRYSHRRFGDSKTAGKCDLVFRDQFSRRRGILRFYVLHLGHMNRANWRGRIVPAWRAS